MGQTRRHFVKTSAKASGAFGILGSLGPIACGPVDGEGKPSGYSSESKRILILGGTRFIGPHQVKYALDRGHEVSIFTRGRTKPPFFHDYFDRVEHLVGDRNNDLTALENGKWDAVIDNSASIPRWVRESAGLLANRADRYLYVSSISAYATYSEVGMTENAPLAQLEDPTTEDETGATYGGRKALCEQAAQEAFGEDAIIVRPGLIVGPGDNTDRWTYWPVRIDQAGEVLAPNSPGDPVQNIDARDLSEWMIRLVEEPGHGGTYNATGPAQPETFGEMLEGIRTALDSDATFTWVSTKFMNEHGIRPWSHMTNWQPAEGQQIGMLQVSVSAAIQHGLTFRPLSDTARDTLAWWNTLSEERRAEPQAGLPTELEAQVLAAWHPNA